MDSARTNNSPSDSRADDADRRLVAGARPSTSPGDAMVLDAGSPAELVGALGGGKAHNLYRLSQSGVLTPDTTVPVWAVLGSDVFRTALATLTHPNAPAGSAPLAATGLAALTASSSAAELDAVAGRVGRLIENLELSPEILGLIQAAHRRVAGDDQAPDRAVAVRSSASVEDGGDLSYAGQFDTYLNVVGLDAVVAAVRGCWASAFSARSLRYRLQHGVEATDIEMAVVLQRLIPAEVSGALFTANPGNGARAEFLLSAVYGLGEGLVSGHVDADTLTLDAATGHVLDVVIGDKAERFDATGADGAGRTVVPEELRAVQALTPSQVSHLHRVGAAVTAYYNAPQDIEWAFADGALHLLQSRPITTPLADPKPSGEARTVDAQPTEATPATTETPQNSGSSLDPTLQLWDNSNLIESFNGITSPLTYTVAREIYFRAYRGYAISLGVGPAQLRQIDEWMPGMLGNFHGRIYYQLLHRYRMARLAPLYRVTRRVLEVALGVSEPMPDDVLDQLYPFTFGNRWEGAAKKARSAAIFARRYLNNGREIAEFSDNFYRTYEKFDAIDYEQLSSEEVFAAFRQMEAEVVDTWGPTMIGDDSLLITFGIVYLMTERWLPDAPQWLTYAAVTPGADVESAGPAEAITRLAAQVRADENLRQLVATTPPKQVYARLVDGEYPEFFGLFNDYVRDYGYRSTDELKLEVPDLREDPTVLLPMLRNALNAPPERMVNDPEAYLDQHLHGLKRRLYDAVRGKGSRLMANRERLRFCRTRAFGLAKRMCRAMGRDLAARGILEAWDDIFFIEFDELRAYFDGALPAADLPGLVRERRQHTDEDSRLIAPPRFETRGDPTTFDLRSVGWRHVDDIDLNAEQVTELRGIGSCPGVVEGIAVVAQNPQDANGGILIAYRTDPGWIAALANATALLIERGSPLTHVAVVARELGIPTIVQLPGITEKIRTGARLRIDGATGVITVLDPNPEAPDEADDPKKTGDSALDDVDGESAA